MGTKLDAAALYLHFDKLVSKFTWRQLARQGKVPCKKVGRKWIFDTDEIEHWFREGDTKSRPQAQEAASVAPPAPENGQVRRLR